MPWTDSVETADPSDEGTHGGAAAAEPGPAEPEAAAEEERADAADKGPTRTRGQEEEEGGCFIDEGVATATTKRARSGIEVLDSDSNSMSEMSLLSMLVAAAAQGLPMWKRCVPPASAPTITMNVSPVMPKAIMSTPGSSKEWFS